MRYIYILILAFTASVLSADEPDQTITVLKPARPDPVVQTPMDFLSNHQPCNAKVEVIKDQGHNLWEGWFHHEGLTNFMIQHAKP